MKNALVLVACLLTVGSYAQEHCSAAFVEGKMVVNEYTPNGRCQLPAKAMGTLTVQTVALTPTDAKALGKIGFKVAIRDKASGTLRMFSGDTFRQLPVQRVLAHCRKGDRVVLLTTQKRYALPHNEILIL